MKLYYNPLSTYSQKVLIAFNEKGLAFEPHVVKLFDPAARAAYEEVYPVGKLPYLQAAGDHAVPESTSIIEYLEDEFPDAPRLVPPAGGKAARQVRFMDRMADFYLNDPVVALLFKKLGMRPLDDAGEARARKHVAMTYAHLDQRLADQPWICGADFSMADCAAIPPLYYAQLAAPFDAHPNVARYFERAKQRPSYARVMDEFVPIWEGMQAA